MFISALRPKDETPGHSRHSKAEALRNIPQAQFSALRLLAKTPRGP